ncbi:guanine nucleotide-releasing factor 2 isoform X3 [Schistocerca gregaria]|uniref:guanine nucleotide-releasing factor 2 isoform X3 n=1 Tax=Schistocerca gregaria TaxID=7010 RepID=UPI00211E2CAC|nr:guanine nucleotide-releasing factor 2 isoform X3 [Schistocerca gregaria]
MSATPKSEKNMSEADSNSSKPRGGKLARRARSFKEDFLEILSQMRSPGSGGGSGGAGSGSQRSGSPHSPKSRSSHKTATATPSVDLVDSSDKNPARDLDLHVRQVQYALKHFRDVVGKNKLEVLPGNGTVVLETVTTIHSMLKMYVLNEQSSALVSATNQVYQSLAKLIKLCDDVLLQGEKALNKENVNEVIHLVEEAVQHLVTLAQDQIAHRESSTKATTNHITHRGPLLDRASNYGLGGTDFPQRSSLPDIPLTPRERQILEQTSTSVTDRHGISSVPHSQSSESILNDTSPPPKPPLPTRSYHISEGSEEPPPLPPKRRQRSTRPTQQQQQQLQQQQRDVESSSLEGSGGHLGTSLERLSLRSRSPEDTSSLLSASAGSLDSVLNHSRDEEELQALSGPADESLHSIDGSLVPGSTVLMNGSSSSSYYEVSSTVTTDQIQSVIGSDKSPSLLTPHSDLLKSPLFSTDMPGIMPGTVIGFDSSVNKLDYSASESGFASMHSVRNSCQSYTASSVSSQQFSSSVSRSSQQSTISCESTSSRTWQVHQSSTKTETSFSNTSVVSGEGSSPSPPALPQKTRQSTRRRDRQLSQYDNVPGGGETISTEVERPAVAGCPVHAAQQSSCCSPDGKPPPLPLKKRHMFQSVAYSVMAYMEMFGNCTHGSTSEFMRHSVHTYNLLQAEWQQQELSLSSTQSCSFSLVSTSQIFPNATTFGTIDSIEFATSSPVKAQLASLPPALPPKRSRTASVKSAATPPPVSPTLPGTSPELHRKVDDWITPSQDDETRWKHEGKTGGTVSSVSKMSDVTQDRETEPSPLDELDITQHLVFKKPDEDGPDIRGGHPDALIIHATKANKNDFLYQEAFLTTYRTFLSPLELVCKLCHRHQRFSCSSDLTKQRAAREAFSLLVRVVSDLTISDLDDVVLKTLMDFVYQLLCSGDLTMAKALRVKILEKYNAKKLQSSASTLLSSLNVYTRQATLLDFKSEQIAEQMTLLDSNLFMKIEIPEVLIWAQEQNEERSPNLTKFTEHFNKMSYWARSRILEQSEAKDRERYVVKFIKIMKHLRKINNFNSYLALLSALDSAPIRRLEWQKHITEGLKEYCALIDSSSSFRAYRQALGDTQPPCIPYIGLVLQDLTFVHIGNNDYLPEGAINFSKRWQQFHIVENMKRFKKGTYSFKKHDRIIAFFNNFDEFLCEEAMWQISESIKPRGGKKPQS